MDEFEISRLGTWIAVIMISLALWAVLIGGMVLL